MFSPGALNAVTADVPKGGVLSHAETKGDCGLCHVAPWSRSTMDERCLNCHTEINSQLSDITTLHGILSSGQGQFECRACHTDHNGGEAGLTLVEITDFPHELVGFSLAGHKRTITGREFSCVDCHKDKIARFDLLICRDCHDGIDQGFIAAHEVAFGGACLECHDGVDRYGKAFDHNSVYKLQGMHRQVECTGCHNMVRKIADFQDAGQTCYDCHAQDDPHQGQMGTDCQACHMEDGWEQVSFDHNQTSFVLVGRHIGVGCQECHTDLSFSGTPSDCFSCHAEDDPHGGQFGIDCGSCHTPVDWADASFDHSLTNFPLTGKHLMVECTGCHEGGIFSGTATSCEACHEEPLFHLGLFIPSCKDCHTTDGWSPALFNGAHTFPISHGASSPSSCKTCHVDSLSTYTCYGCHEHTPGGIAAKHLEEGISNFTNCIACHPTGLEEGGENGGRGDDD